MRYESLLPQFSNKYICEEVFSKVLVNGGTKSNPFGGNSGNRIGFPYGLPEEDKLKVFQEALEIANEYLMIPFIKLLNTIIKKGADPKA